MENINSWRFWTPKNKCVNKFKKYLYLYFIYLYVKNPYEVKYQYLINKNEKVDLRHCDYPKTFIEHSNDMQDVHKDIEEYNPGKKCKILIVFDDIIADMISNKKLNLIVTELLIRGRKLNISIIFLHNHILRYQKRLGYVLHIIFWWKFQTKECFGKLG